ncbi:extracellular solute-binding protein [Streptomyces sp. NPDC048496]|uniref:extracellular solute-binding protein n=1 Tax=Streptomyces sp. NPDC048496 TaxID=3365558 RepID=UPI00371DB7A6
MRTSKVKTDFQDYGNFWKKFNAQASAGNVPDVFQNSVAFLRTYDDKRVLLALDSQAKAGNLRMENFRAGLEKAGDVNGKLLGVPVGGNTFALVHTNDTALYGLAAIENLALVGDRMPA